MEPSIILVPVYAASVRDIRRALRRLAPVQGRIARRNARHALRSAVGRLLELVDRDFPGVRRRRSRAGRRTPGERMKRLAARGWISLNVCRDRMGMLTALAAAGIRVRETGDSTTMIPKWAVEVGPNAKVLEKLKRDPIGRKAFLVKRAMLNTKETLTF